MVPFLFGALSAHAADAGVLTVDVMAGGMMRAAIILTARHGVSIHFEGAPRNVEGASFVLEPHPDGTVRHKPVEPSFAFSYPSAATPRQAADAAVAAWNATPAVPCHYKVVETNGVLHFVPTEVRRADGTFEIYRPLLDTELVLDRTTGTPTHLWHHTVEKLASTAGVPVLDVTDGFAMLGSATMPEGDPRWMFQAQLDVTLPQGQGTARELLDLVLASNDVATNWVLIWFASPDPTAAGWRIVHTIARPEDEATFNRTPLVPAP